MLLQVQKPGLTYAASAWDWKTRFDRTIKEGARPLVILWPFSPVAFVYDVLDTGPVRIDHVERRPQGVSRRPPTTGTTSRQG